MSKTKKLLLPVLSVCIIIPVFILIHQSQTSPDFFRSYFKTKAELTYSSSQKNVKNSETDGEPTVSAKILPKRREKKFSGKYSFYLRPGISGKRNIFFSIRVKVSQASEINILLIRSKQVRVLKKIKRTNKNINFVFSNTLDLKKNDIIQVEAAGKGKLTVTNAIVFKHEIKKKQKYVFIIALDNLRWDEVGKKINGVELTPNLNKLKEDAVDFKNAYAQSSWTLPSFSSFFTGLYEFNHLVTRFSSLSDEMIFLPELFSDDFINLSIHGGVWLSGRGVNYRGFDLFHLGSRHKDEYAAKNMFDSGEYFLDQIKGQNLFMFLHTYAIHSNYKPPRQYILKLNKNPKHYANGPPSISSQFKNNISEEEKLSLRELYQAEVMAFDDFFGQFVKMLKTRKIYNRSLLVFFSDHGEEFYEHNGWFHGHSLYNELIKVPLIIKFPNQKFRGKSISANVAVIDILPTLLDYFKIKHAANTDGISLMPLIKQKAINRKYIFSSTTTCYLDQKLPKKIAVISENFKLILNYPIPRSEYLKYNKNSLPPELDKMELYNLKKDPGEVNNIFGATYELIRKMKNQIIKLNKKIQINLKKSPAKKSKMSPEEKATLKTLGYL